MFSTGVCHSRTVKGGKNYHFCAGKSQHVKSRNFMDIHYKILYRTENGQNFCQKSENGAFRPKNGQKCDETHPNS